MIKKRLKCSKCGKELLQIYSTAVKAVVCNKCGMTTVLKTKEENKNVDTGRQER